MSSKKCSKCGDTKALTEFDKYHDEHQAYCKTCKAGVNAETNTDRMYVNGKYIPKSHPMHKPGRYKTFGDAAFENMIEGKDSPEGYVYIITNDAWPDWVKVGMAVDAEDRLRGYQTSSPFRDYDLYAYWQVPDRRAAEAAAHQILREQYRKENEWFRCYAGAAEVLIRGTMEDMASGL